MIITRVADVIRGKSLAHVSPSDTVAEACRVLCELDVGACVVISEDQLVGVLSERDVMRKCLCQGHSVEQMKVEQAMTGEVKSLPADGSLAEAIEIMKSGGFHHVPIVADGLVIGMLSNDDIPEEYRLLLEQFKEFRGS